MSEPPPHLELTFTQAIVLLAIADLVSRWTDRSVKPREIYDRARQLDPNFPQNVSDPDHGLGPDLRQLEDLRFVHRRPPVIASYGNEATVLNPKDDRFELLPAGQAWIDQLS